MSQGTVLLFMIVVIFAAMYFMAIRPQNKRMREQQQMVQQATEGTRVMLTSQIIGTIKAVGDKQMVIELAPGVEITAMRQAIVRVVPPEEEEFEFADEAGADVVITDDELGTVSDLPADGLSSELETDGLATGGETDGLASDQDAHVIVNGDTTPDFDAPASTPEATPDMVFDPEEGSEQNKQD